MTKKNTGNDYYRTYAAVDLDAIEHNLAELKKKIKTDVLSLAIVKADAYGHGAVGVAKTIQDKVDYFGIAELGEAVELREAGVEKPILVLSYTSPYQYETLIKNELTQTIFNYDDAVALSQAAVKLKKIARVHIAVDTGMSRIGFFCNDESVETVKRINDLPNIYIDEFSTNYTVDKETGEVIEISSTIDAQKSQIEDPYADVELMYKIYMLLDQKIEIVR